MSQLAVRLPTMSTLLVAGLVVLTSLFLLFLVALDQGVALASVGSALNSATTHELFHDARHLLGVPCH